MKINTKDFATALTKVKVSVGNLIDFPILSCIALETKDNLFWVTSFNQKIATKTAISYEGEDLHVLVDFNLLSNIVSNLLDETINLELEGNQLSIISKSSAFSIAIANNPDEFPPLITHKSELTCSCQLNWLALQPIIKELIAFTGDSSSSPVFTTIWFNRDISPSEIAAGTTFVVAKYTITEGIELPDKTILLSNDLLTVALTALAKGDVTFELYGNIARFYTDTTEVIGFTTLGKMPPYNTILKNSGQYTIVVDKQKLEKAINLLAKINNKETVPYITFIEKDNQLLLTNTIRELASGTVKVDCEEVTEGLKISFNFETILLALKPFKEQITIELEAPDKIALVEGDTGYVVGASPRISF